jgi:hypothetical protein
MVRKGLMMARMKKGSQQIMKALMIIPKTVDALCSFNPPNTFPANYNNLYNYFQNVI